MREKDGGGDLGFGCRWGGYQGPLGDEGWGGERGWGGREHRIGDAYKFGHFYLRRKSAASSKTSRPVGSRGHSSYATPTVIAWRICSCTFPQSVLIDLLGCLGPCAGCLALFRMLTSPSKFPKTHNVPKSSPSGPSLLNGSLTFRLILRSS